MTRKALASVLRNFLGTYTSRYSDSHGYWLFGFMVESLHVSEIDLLSTDMTDFPDAQFEAITVARKRFLEQLNKHGLNISKLKSARLTITRGGKTTQKHDAHQFGYEVNFRAEAISDLGKKFEAEEVIFIAPHDPKVEGRSTRADLPPFDQQVADSFVGKKLLIEVTILDHEGNFLELRQSYGKITGASERMGFELEQLAGTEYLISLPDWRKFKPAGSGEYKIRSTGEVLTGVDLVYAFTVRRSRPAGKVGNG